VANKSHSSWEAIVKAWFLDNFRDPKTAFASVMAIAGGVGTLCCSAIIAIVLMVQR
jgi:hypothetical protein